MQPKRILEGTYKQPKRNLETSQEGMYITYYILCIYIITKYVHDGQ